MRVYLKYLLFSVLILVFLSAIATAVPRPTKEPLDTTDYSNITENLVFNFPEDDNFKLGFKHEDSIRWVNIYYPKGQSTYKWQEMIWHEYLVQTAQRINLPGTARKKYLQARKSCPDATWNILSKSGKDSDYPFIIFEIKCPKYVVDEPADIQLWKIIGGKTGLFVVEWSYRGDEIPDDRKEEILKYLDEATLVARPKGKI